MMRPRRPRRCRQTQQVFGEKEAAGELEPEVEKPVMGLPPRRHRVGQHDRYAEDDHRVMHDPKHPRGGAGGFGLQGLIEPLPAHGPF